MSPHKLAPQPFVSSAESKVHIHLPEPAGTGALAGQSRVQPPGAVRMAAPVALIARHDVRDALLNGRNLTVALQVDGEQLQVRVTNRQLDILRERADLAPVYREDFVTACEATTIRWQGPFSAEVAAALAIVTHDGKREHTEVHHKPPSAPLLRLLVRGGLFAPEFADGMAQAQARARVEAQAQEQVQPTEVLHAAAGAEPVSARDAFTGIAACALAAPGIYFDARFGRHVLRAVYVPATQELQFSRGIPPQHTEVAVCNFRLSRRGLDHDLVGVYRTGSDSGRGLLRIVRLFGVLRPDAPPQVKAMVLGATAAGATAQ
ncbi:hypothetical protein [Ramlibacter albus]|uniref:Uncharacterized protein n=1 Tax=Ramlibacter albus TaxID=2079448 RepID=A0A923S1G9_9BURK|nr:hypothetical protein [Ramlibacter albus]MBC5764404.1 hypothetical protein [Ramlibacter albus]